MSLKDILELVAILPPEQQYSAIATITESLGIIPSVAPQLPPNEVNIGEATGIPSYITGIG